jgi:hypothetical protein
MAAGIMLRIVVLLHDGAGQLSVWPMAGAHGDDVAEDAPPGEHEVANDV